MNYKRHTKHFIIFKERKIQLKKLLLFTASLSIIFGLAACGNNDDANEPQEILLTPKTETKQSEQQEVEKNDTPETPVEELNPVRVEEVGYTIILQRVKDHFPFLLVVVPDEDSTHLTAVAQQLKEEYKDGVTVIFFTEESQAEALNTNSEEAFAKLIVNPKGNVSKLVFFNDQKPISIQ